MEEFIPIVFIVMVAAVAVFRPITKRLGLLLEAMAKERIKALEPPTDAQTARLTHQIEQMSGRLELMEDRVEFMEKLLSSDKDRERLSR